MFHRPPHGESNNPGECAWALVHKRECLNPHVTIYNIVIRSLFIVVNDAKNQLVSIWINWLTNWVIIYGLLTSGQMIFWGEAASWWHHLIAWRYIYNFNGGNRSRWKGMFMSVTFTDSSNSNRIKIVERICKLKWENSMFDLYMWNVDKIRGEGWKWRENKLNIKLRRTDPAFYRLQGCYR